MQIQLNRYASRELDLIAAGLPEGADALVFTKAVRQRSGRAMFIARDDTRASGFIAACRFFAPDIPVLSLPSWDCLPYDRVSPSRTLAARRSAALHSLLIAPTDKPLIIVTTISGATQKVAPRSVIASAGFQAREGQQLKREVLESYLSDNGYSRASTVMEAGDFAIRGGLIDIFPPALDNPIRLDFFGDELESIRAFDVETQRTTSQLKNVQLAPVSEVLMSDLAVGTFRKNYIAAFGGGVSKDPIYASVVEGIGPQGIEHYLPLFYPHLETVFDYAGADTLVAYDGLLEEAKAERRDLIEDFYSSRQEYVEARDTGSGDPSKSAGVYRPLKPERLYVDEEQWTELTGPLQTRNHTAFIPPDAENKVDFGGKLARSFSIERRTEGANVFEALVDYVRTLKNEKKRILIAAWTEGSSERLGNVLEDHNLVASKEERGPDALAISPGTVRRVVLPIEQGFTFGDLSIISEQDILGDRLVNRGRKRKAKNFISEAAALTPGDLIIHIDHGLGRYLGLQTLQVQDAPHDCLQLEYNGGAKLYLPVENIELLSRYGSASEGAVLDKLGGVAWQSRKAKAKQRLKDMAGELIVIAAKRAMRTCEPTVIEEGPYNEFCARFPYAETDDQLSAIEDVFGDLKSGKPMDRLICGDVGFGKTEVALRAVFAVAMSGKQVAIVAPTTILSRQHFKTFSDRFRGWPVKVRQLSRLVSGKDAKAAKEELAKGQCEIVVGTHALLAKSIQFSDLGMIIVDEEQRFGVQHKERLKALRADMHVLTLTATPIPRTLQMALSGIRDLSLIATPPVDRLAVRTYVSPFDEVSIRKAILRERYRGGQSFFVAPRIADIPRIEEFMRESVPEVKYVIAHGQMAPGALEDIMTAFYDGQYDVLISTSIIESGIDIPSANTMIIYRADRFGLAQLYQMRGRVGRSKVRAYAYLTMPEAHMATQGAQQRLKILQSLDTLGAGFTLASHDLDMRGGGNPLGEEQSGHIKDLGVELYQHMLEEAVAELRNDDTLKDQSWSPQVNVGVAILIPERYIQDLNLRLATYRRISEVEDDEAGDALAAELIDRFGPLPEEVDSLLKVMKIKRLCRQAHVEKVDAGPMGVVLTVRHKDVSDPSIILNAITQNSGWRLRPDQTILVKGNFEKPATRLKATERAVKALIL
ncbi:transcription-repair coupling factor [Hellea sp.]|nr:transcription-repair coupling factor [Hellea sp.]